MDPVHVGSRLAIQIGVSLSATSLMSYEAIFSDKTLCSPPWSCCDRPLNNIDAVPGMGNSMVVHKQNLAVHATSGIAHIVFCSG